MNGQLKERTWHSRCIKVGRRDPPPPPHHPSGDVEAVVGREVEGEHIDGGRWMEKSLSDEAKNVTKSPKDPWSLVAMWALPLGHQQ